MHIREMLITHFSHKKIREKINRFYLELNLQGRKSGMKKKGKNQRCFSIVIIKSRSMIILYL